MQDSNPFTAEEFEGRRERVRRAMSEQGWDACLIVAPENVYYLTGLDHMGYFAYQALVLPVTGEPVLVTRAMERAVVRDLASGVRHLGYQDGTAKNSAPLSRDMGALEPPLPQTAKNPPPAAEATCEALSDLGVADGRIGFEQGASFLPHAILNAIFEGLPCATFGDCSGLVEEFRLVQSDSELACTRKAAAVSDSMMLAAIAAAGPGVNHREVMAAIYDALFRRGGTYPGFVPLVRSNTNLEHEHGTWLDVSLSQPDRLFLEMAGCIRRYHAPMGRLVFIGEATDGAERANEICREAMYAAGETIRPGVKAGDVYERWQGVLERAGIGEYRRHHCGYSVGIGYPPSWSGGGVPVGLRAHSDLELKAGMVFHLMSWLLNSPAGDAFLSDTIVVTEDGCEFLTKVDRGVTVR